MWELHTSRVRRHLAVVGSSRQADRKRRATAWAVAGGPHRAALCFGKAADDREPQAHAAVRAIAGGIDTIKAIEQVWQMLGGDSATDVSDSDLNRVSLTGDAHVNAAAGRRHLARIVKQIA